jgi:predicted phosphodiesterase
MRVAVISDVHANLPALRAALADIRTAQPDAIVSCGDLAAGPLPDQAIDLLRSLDLPVHYVRGNCDRAMVEASDGGGETAATYDDQLIWAGPRLTSGQRDFLNAFSAGLTLDIDGLGPVLFCHGSPRRDDEVILQTSSQQRLDAVLGGTAEHTIVCGHTHMQFDRQAARHRLINVGSVGMPYGDPGAYWALLGPDVSLRRTDYDLQAAANEIRETSHWAHAGRFAADCVLTAVPADEALAYFEQLQASADA